MRINRDKLEMKIKDGEQLFQTQEYILVPEPNTSQGANS